jgi:tRNA-dihydrouridine synthase
MAEGAHKFCVAPMMDITDCSEFAISCNDLARPKNRVL